MNWKNINEIEPEEDGAYIISDGEITSFGTYSIFQKQWKTAIGSDISQVLWWRNLPELPRHKVCGDIDDMGKYLYDCM